MAEPFFDNPQVAAQVRQLLAERANAEAYGQSTRMEAVDKQLAGLGYKADKKTPAKDEEPQGRKAPTRRTTAAGKE